MKKLGIWIVGILLLTALAQADLDPGHSASQISPGTIVSALTITNSKIGVGMTQADLTDITDTLTIKNILRLLPLTSAPTSCNEGSMYYDSTQKQVYVCDDAGWNAINGIEGTNGIDGTDGMGISSTAYDETTGILTLTYSDSTTFSTSDLRGITGIVGTDGINGTNGMGISSTAYDGPTGILTLTYSDSTTFSTSDLRGITGIDGINGTNGIDGTDGINGTNGTSCTISDTVPGADITCGINTVSITDGTGTAGSDNYFIGKTASTYTGLIINGYVGANNACNSEFIGSHVCSVSEIFNTINDKNLTILSGWLGDAWVNGGPPGFNSVAVTDCTGWTTNLDSVYGRYWEFNSENGGNGLIINCNSAKPFACCGGVN